MEYTKTYEKFTEAEYLKRKGKKEKKMVQRLGEHYIIDIVAEGDFEGLNYLLNKGFSLKKCSKDENLLVIAIKNNQPEMIDYLINKSDYFENSGWKGKDDYINSISLPELIGQRKAYVEQTISKEAVEWLKTITKLGYNFRDESYNYIELYLSRNHYKGNNKYEITLIKGIEPFIDWLLENYPENYPLVKDCLNGSKEANDIKKKYKYLDDALKYNI